jgi:hypothetical protein
MWHLISGSFSHGIFPDPVLFQQIQRDSSQLESGILYAVDCLLVLLSCIKVLSISLKYAVRVVSFIAALMSAFSSCPG